MNHVPHPEAMEPRFIFNKDTDMELSAVQCWLFLLPTNGISDLCVLSNLGLIEDIIWSFEDDVKKFKSVK